MWLTSRLLAVLFTMVALLLAAGDAQAATQTLTFDELAANAAVADQYAAAPNFLRLGRDFDDNPQVIPIAARDLGADNAHSGSIAIEAYKPHCGVEICNFNSTGTVITGSFTYPKRFVSFWAKAKSSFSGTKTITLTAYDGSGNPYPAVTKALSATTWTQVSFTAPAGQNILAFFIRDENETTPDEIDDLSFDVPDNGVEPTPDVGFTRSDQFAGEVGLTPGDSRTVGFDVRRYGYTGGVSLSVTGLPKGVSGSLVPSKYTDPAKKGHVDLNLAAADTAANQEGEVTVTATPDNASLPPRTLKFRVFVQAVYDIDAAPPEVFQAVQKITGLGYQYDQVTRAGAYDGVRLVRHKRTVVRGYATISSGAPATGVTNVQGLLYGSRNGLPLPGSPLSSASGRQTLLSRSKQIISTERRDLKQGFTFTLPPEWTDGTLDLKFQAYADNSTTIDLSGNPAPQQECDGCGGNNAFTLTGVPFTAVTTPYTIQPVWMTYQRGPATGGQNYALQCSLAPGDPSPAACGGSTCPAPTCSRLPAPETMVRQFIASAPLAEENVHVLPVEQMDISALAAAPFSADKDGVDINRDGGDAKDDEGWQQIARWAITRELQSVGVADLFGLPQPGQKPADPIQGNVMLGINDQIARGIEWTLGNVSFGNSIRVKSRYPIAVIDRNIGADDIHELGHALGRPHASFGCNGNANGQKGEAWPTPEGEYLVDEYGFVSMPALGAANPAVQALVPPDATKTVPKGYDAMSYCAGKGTPWMSIKGWGALLGAFGSSARSARVAQVAQADPVPDLPGKPGFEVRGYAAGDGSVHLTSAQPQSVGVAQPAAGSPYTLGLVDRKGKTVATAPMEAGDAHADTAGVPAPVTFLTGDLPIKAAAKSAGLQVRYQGKVVARRTRSRHKPRVRIGKPKIKNGRLLVTLRVRDRDRKDRLHVVVAYRAKGKRFTQLYDGKPRKRLSLPVTGLAAGTKARVRAVVDDGWNVTAALSKRFRTKGKLPAKPKALLVWPQPGERQARGSSFYMSGSATTATGVPIPGRELRWFDGTRPIGSGGAIATDRLRRGRHRIRLVATDARGRRDVATTHVTITR